jgi:hypothetical protein
MKLTYLLPILLLIISCKIQKGIYKNCEMPEQTLTVDEYVEALDENKETIKKYEEALENWEECLIAKRAKEKNKKELYNEISGKHIKQGMLEGIEGEVSSYYLSFKALARILSDKELNQNLYSDDSAIKYHSFLTIAERKKQNVFEALKVVLNDTTQITTQFGCIVEETTLSDLCIEQVTEKYFYKYEGFQTDKYQLTLEEKNELDDLVLSSELELKYRGYLEKEKK